MAALSAAAGIFGMLAFAVPSLSAFRDPGSSYLGALLLNLVDWSICMGGLVIAIRFTRLAVRKG